MKWAKAKTIFIYIFIFVNIFLFTVYRMNSFEGKQTDKEEVVKILENYGIESSADVFKNFPDRMKQMEAVNISEGREFFEKLLGEGFEINNGIAVNKTKSFNISGGEYTDSSPDIKKFKNVNESNISGKLADFLSDAGISKKTLLHAKVSAKEDGKIYASAGYRYEGYPVFGAGVEAIAKKEGLYSLKGRFLSFSQVEKRYYNICPSESVLLDYLSLYGNKYGKGVSIKEISVGYFIPGELNLASSYAIPAYEFSFSNNKTLILDARENIQSASKFLSEN